MTNPKTEIGSNFFARWILYTTVGYVLGMSVGFLLGHILLGNVMVGMAIGTGVGYFQWLLLRRYVPHSSFWIVDCVAGMTVALALYSVVNTVWGYPFDLGVPHGAVGWGIAFVVAGSFAGVFQYRILRRTIPRSLAWVPVSAIAWGVSVIGLAIPPEMEEPMSIWMLFPRNLLLPPAAAGLILGFITGAVIISILKSAEPIRDHVGRDS